MKVLLFVTLLSFGLVANAKISDEVLKCRWESFGEDISVLYINMYNPKMPGEDMINRFCHKVNSYKTCVSSDAGEQMTVELMEGMCEYGFKAVYNNMTCLKTAVRVIKAVCAPRRGNCENSYQWFQCSQIVTQNLCGEVLGFMMATLQPFYCQISEAMQFNDIQLYNMMAPAEDQVNHNGADQKNAANPDKTAKTVATAKPAATTKSVATANPAPTTKSVTTAKPAPTTKSVTTAKPAPTTKSVTTAKPAPTTKSVTTAKPAPTTKSVTTAKPAPTTKSATTAKPAPTTKSVTTAKPAPTTKAVTTKGPVTTIKPITTTNSGISNLPSCVTSVLSIVVAAHIMKGF